MGGLFQQIAEGVNLASGNQTTTSQPNNPLLSALQDFSHFQNTIGGKGDEVVAKMKHDRLEKQKASLGEDLVNQIALQPSADKKSASVKIPREHLDLLQGVQSQGPEAVREMSNFLAKGSSNEELKKHLPNLINEYSSKGLMSPTERMIVLSEMNTNPESAFNKVISIANNARSQTSNAITAQGQAIGSQISDLKGQPDVQQSQKEAKVAEIFRHYTPEQLSSIDLKDKSTHPGLSTDEANLTLDMLRRGADQGIKPQASFLDPVQNYASQLVPSLVNPAAKVVSPGELANSTKRISPDAQKIEGLKKTQQDLLKQKAGTQFRGPKPQVGSSGDSEMVSIMLDGKPKKIPKANLQKAQSQFGKRLQVR